MFLDSGTAMAANCIDYHEYLHWIGSTDLSMNPEDVVVEGEYAYVADALGRLIAVNVADPANPVIVSVTPLAGGGCGLDVEGGCAVIAVSSLSFTGVQIVEIDDPASPVLVCTVDTYDPRDVAISGDYAYVADWESGLQVIDISTPGVARIVATLYGINEAVSVTVAGDIAFVADYWEGLISVDISDPTLPIIIGSVAFTNPIDVDVDGAWAYVTATFNRVVVVDISTPEEPRIATDFDTPGRTDGVLASGDLLFVADRSTGILVIDKSNPMTMTILGCVYMNGAKRAAVKGTAAFVTSSNGIQVVDFSNPESAPAGSLVGLDGDARHVTVNGDYAYVSHYWDGLDVIDVSDKDHPRIVGSIDMDYAEGTDVSGNHVYVANGDFQVVDVANPASTNVAASLVTPGWSHDVVVSGELAYIADGAAGLMVVDISDPGTPSIVGVVATPDDAYGVAVSGGYAYVAAFMEGLAVIDVCDPQVPVVVGSIDLPGTYEAVAVEAAYAYVVGLQGLQVVNIADPTLPWVMAGLDTPHQAVDIAIDGDIAYVADSSSCCEIIDIAVPGEPRRIGNINTLWESKSVAVSDGHVFISGGSGQLMIMPVQCSVMTLTYLQSIDIMQDRDVVTIRWQVSHADGSCIHQLVGANDRQEWSVPYNVGSDGTTFDAVDRSPHLFDSPVVTYRLSLGIDGSNWELLAESTVDLQMPQAGSRIMMAYPNPFNPAITIRYENREPGYASLSVYDLAGHLVKRLAGEWMMSGTHERRWDGRDGSGRLVGAGRYVISLEVGDDRSTMQIGLVR
jgi:hypothetical protein